MYPAREEQGRWRAVWHEDGQRQQCEAVSEENLAAKLEKVTERLEAGAPDMTRPGADLIAHYLNPDRLPVGERWSRKHAHTQGRLCERYAVPVIWIQVKYRTYDSEQLNPLRRQPSGDARHKNRHEIHHDPYDVSRIWVRDPGGGWITAFWKHLHRVPVPFGELAWDHIRAGLPGAAEHELADAVAALLTRAHGGPGRTDRKVAARTRAVPRAHQCPRPAVPLAAGDDPGHRPGAVPDSPAAAVVPLPVFDPFTEARKRW